MTIRARSLVIYSNISAAIPLAIIRENKKYYSNDDGEKLADLYSPTPPSNIRDII